jgi:hypothetical protein
VYHHIDRVFFTVVNKGNGLVMLLNPINGYPHFNMPGVRLPDGDVIDSLAIPVVHLE